MDFGIEENDPLGARAGVLKIGSTEIPTPVRVLTSADIFYGRRLATATEQEVIPVFPHQLYQVKRAYNPTKFAKLLRSPKSMECEREKLERGINVQPTSVAWFDARIPNWMHITDAQNTVLFDLGLDAGFDIHTIYDSRRINPQELLQRIKDSKKKAEDYKNCKGILVKLSPDQRMKTLLEKAKIICEETDGITVKFAPPKGTRITKLLALKAETTKEEKFFAFSDCPKWWNQNKTSSMMHCSQLFGADAFALRLGNWFKTERVIQPKRFDSSTYGYLTVPKMHYAYHSSGTDCHSGCPVCKKYPDMATQTHEFSPEEQNIANRVHEAFESQKEFDECRAAIMDSPTELRKHLKDKTFAKDPILRFHGIDINPMV